ncbi:hypothetical protein Y032_0009g733 [Ancylostoma ceylanicum]|uniref:Uncharacterized protein n=1 Tax=Ancylostoma ceylanicum TaxID=53326 RepID=A0A016VIK2_9BILA|nr:hypothetical protein Y032_0009g733 [Ancylostoma ceylanicum]
MTIELFPTSLTYTTSPTLSSFVRDNIHDNLYSLLAQNVHQCRLCPQLRPQWYRPADRPAPSETAAKHQNGRNRII